MARPRKPTELLELNGAFRINPQRKRDIGPKSPHELGNPPQHLTEVEADIWDEAQHYAAAGVLTGGDRWLLARFCQLEAKVRTGDISASDGVLHIRCLSLMGLTPADRSRIHADKAPEENPYSEFMN